METSHELTWSKLILNISYGLDIFDDADNLVIHSFQSLQLNLCIHQLSKYGINLRGNGCLIPQQGNYLIVSS
ncbi:hypothetical protein V6Z11_D10G220600 [Gossypium hirsutum]